MDHEIKRPTRPIRDTRRAALALFALAVAALGGCAATAGSTDGGGGGSDAPSGASTGSCRESSGSGSTGFTLCIDYTGLTADQVTAIRSTCTDHDGGVTVGDASVPVMISGTYSSGSLCDRTGALGGCQISSGGFSQTTWYFAGAAGADTWRSACMTGGGTWVTP